MVAAGPAERSPWDIADPVGADRHPSLICREPNLADVLQVTVARLLGYRWPAELDPDMRLDIAQRAWVERCDALLGFADADGIVCIPSVRGKEPAAERLRPVLEKLRFDDPRVPVYTNVDAAPVADGARAREALLRQVTGAVRWQELIEKMIGDGFATFVEVGPGKVLAGLVRRIRKDAVVLSAGDPEGVERVVRELGGGA